MRSRTPNMGRPVGTDGSDFAFRMTVDSRYKKAAEKRLLLQKLVTAQAAFQILKAITIAILLTNGDSVTTTSVASCILGGIAVVAGTLGHRKSSSFILNTFIFATSATVMLSIVPFILGEKKNKVITSWMSFPNNGDYKGIIIDGLEIVQEVVGVIVQVFCISAAFSLLHFSRRTTS